MSRRASQPKQRGHVSRLAFAPRSPRLLWSKQSRSRYRSKCAAAGSRAIIMILTTRNLPHYLLSRNLISYESVVDGDLVITDASHRNRAFRVLCGSRPGYFVKQIRDWDTASIAYWENEAACYRK